MKLGNLFGIPIRASPLWFCVALAFFVTGRGRMMTLALLVLATHELAHVLVAKGYGLEIERMELTPFGGVMSIPYPIELDPLVEMSVAIAGPLNNLLLFAAGTIMQRSQLFAGQTAGFFLDLNLSMALFNLVPVLPLDGGRVCRAYLSPKMGYRDATLALLNLRAPIIVSLFLVSAMFALWGRFLPLSFALALLLVSKSGDTMETMNLVVIEGIMVKKRKLASKGQLPVKHVVALESLKVRSVVAGFQPDAYHVVTVCDPQFRPKGTLTERDLVGAMCEGKHDWALRDLLGDSRS